MAWMCVALSVGCRMAWIITKLTWPNGGRTAPQSRYPPRTHRRAEASCTRHRAWRMPWSLGNRKDQRSESALQCRHTDPPNQKVPAGTRCLLGALVRGLSNQGRSRPPLASPGERRRERRPRKAGTRWGGARRAPHEWMQKRLLESGKAGVRGQFLLSTPPVGGLLGADGTVGRPQAIPPTPLQAALLPT